MCHLSSISYATSNIYLSIYLSASGLRSTSVSILLDENKMEMNKMKLALSLGLSFIPSNLYILKLSSSTSY